MSTRLGLPKALVFISTKYFDREWRKIGLSDQEQRSLENTIMAGPSGFPLMPGTGGLRKIRVARDRGKSGGARVCFAYFSEFEVVLLYTVYAKNDQENLSGSAKTIAKIALAAFANFLQQKGSPYEKAL